MDTVGPPIERRCRKLPPDKVRIAVEAIRKLKKLGIIRPPKNSRVSPLQCVQKSNLKWRTSPTNAITRSDRRTTLTFRTPTYSLTSTTQWKVHPDDLLLISNDSPSNVRIIRTNHSPSFAEIARLERKSTSLKDHAADVFHENPKRGTDVEIQENRPIPTPKPNEVLLEMAYVGICGSDVHYLVHGRIGNFVLKEPMVCGHEASGIVVAVGENVKNLVKGDRVAIEPGASCRICQYCKEGLYNLCPDIAFCATPPYHGNLARYYVHAADYCFKLPENVSLEEGALVEPLSVAVHACTKAGVGLGSNVLITGAGPIGMVTLFAAKAMSAKNVIITDIQQKRLDMAKKFGADHTILVKPDGDVNETVNKIRSLIGDDPDKTIDCSGFESSVRLAIEATRPGGVIVLVGMGAQEVKTSLIPAIVKEIKIIGSFRYANNYPMALEMIASKKADVKQLVTDRYKLEETVEAFERAKTGEALKVMIQCIRRDNVF